MNKLMSFVTKSSMSVPLSDSKGGSSSLTKGVVLALGVLAGGFLLRELSKASLSNREVTADKPVPKNTGALSSSKCNT